MIKKNQKSYELYEIVFSENNKQNFDKKYNKILLSIKDIGFKQTASIYSISSTANLGGKIGWVNQNQLSKKFLDRLTSLELGSFTEPINSGGGSIIIMINDIKEVSVENIDKEIELSKLISAEKNRQLNEFSIIHLKKLKINHMSKNFNPIIVVAGEPKSVFLELFFKSYKKFKKNPLILIANKKLLIDQLKLLKFKRSIKILNDKKN